jgi:transcriptional regulator with GAF, ATPase, and Fis domain
MILEFMGVTIHVLFLQDLLKEDEPLPGFISSARVCFIPFYEGDSAQFYQAINRVLNDQITMPFVLLGHAGGLVDYSFVINGFLKMPTFDQLQQCFYAADAHWSRLKKSSALHAYIREEINQALEDANVEINIPVESEFQVPTQSQLIKHLNETSLTYLNDTLVGQSDGMLHVKHMIARVHEKNASVLITGESGTGKEVVARVLHDLSPRRNKAFVPVNCGAIPAELLESELFGHEKGAFTGAIAARAGRFEMAEGGTIFLDEIGDMPLNMQVKILRVLQERVFERVGATKSLECNVRVIAATHRNLEDMIDKNTFRADLFYRLNVFPIEVPALRERVADLPMLIPVLIKRLSEQHEVHIDFDKKLLNLWLAISGQAIFASFPICLNV